MGRCLYGYNYSPTYEHVYAPGAKKLQHSAALSLFQESEYASASIESASATIFVRAVYFQKEKSGDLCLKYFYGVYCKKKKIIQKGEFIK